MTSIATTVLLDGPEPTMRSLTVDLPPSVHHYFSGRNARDFTVAASGFAPFAVVRDEGHDHLGPAAIRAWIERSAARYDDIAEPRRAFRDGSRVEVLANVSGTFPGSPILLRFHFTLDEGQIVRLEIKP